MSLIRRLPDRLPMENVTLFLALIISACLTAAAGSGGHLWLVWVSLMPFFLTIQMYRPLGATLSGAVWGACLYFVSVTFVSGGITASLSSLVLLAAIPALYAFFGTVFTRRFGFSPLALALGWIGVELALNPLGLKNGLLAAAPEHTTLFSLVGAFLGYGFVAFLVVLANALLLSIVGGVSFQLPSSEPLLEVPRTGVLTLTTTFFSLPFIYIRFSRPRAPPLRFAMTG